MCERTVVTSPVRGNEKDGGSYPELRSHGRCLEVSMGGEGGNGDSLERENISPSSSASPPVGCLGLCVCVLTPLTHI